MFITNIKGVKVRCQSFDLLDALSYERLNVNTDAKQGNARLALHARTQKM